MIQNIVKNHFGRTGNILNEMFFLEQHSKLIYSFTKRCVLGILPLTFPYPWDFILIGRMTI